MINSPSTLSIRARSIVVIDPIPGECRADSARDNLRIILTLQRGLSATFHRIAGRFEIHHAEEAICFPVLAFTVSAYTDLLMLTYLPPCAVTSSSDCKL